jgi:hypothetical protein
MDDWVYALTVYNGELIAGGHFTTAGGVTCDYIAAWGPAGACCYADGSCQVSTQSACTGNFIGVGTVCIPNPCPQPEGACCFADWTCNELTEADCLGAGGQWLGFGTDCDPNPCPPMICYTPAALSAQCELGTNPQPQTFTVRNCGSGIMNYTITVDADWLWCDPVEGQSSGEQDQITVYYDTTSLPAGQYEATITITAPLATNSPQSIPVSLNVSAYSWQPLGSGMNNTVYALTVYNGELIAGGRLHLPPAA